MASIKISSDNVLWLNEKFPDLKLDKERRSITGKLSFSATCVNGQVCTFSQDKEHDSFIEDQYKIEIDFEDETSFPSIKDVDGKIRKIAEEKNINNKFIHVEKYNIACICLPHRRYELLKELEKNDNPLEFLIYKAIQFFYHQSYVLKFNKEPWKGYSHGKQGITDYVEEESDNKVLRDIELLIANGDLKNARNMCNEYIHSANIEKALKEKTGRNEVCPCGSKRKYKKCHLHEVERIKKIQFRLYPQRKN